MFSLETTIPVLPLIAAILVGACSSESATSLQVLAAEKTVSSEHEGSPIDERQPHEAGPRYVTIYDGKPTCSAGCLRKSSGTSIAGAPRRGETPHQCADVE